MGEGVGGESNGGAPMIRSALVTTAFFILLHVSGCGRFVSVLSGTLEGGRWGLFLGLLYALSWFSVVLLVPVLLLAGLSRAVVRRLARG